jgi:hypothetical protein
MEKSIFEIYKIQSREKILRTAFAIGRDQTGSPMRKRNASSGSNRVAG